MQQSKPNAPTTIQCAPAAQTRWKNCPLVVFNLKLNISNLGGNVRVVIYMPN